MIIISINQAIKCLGRTDHWVKETNFPLKHKLEIIRIKMNSLVWIFYCNYSTANTRILLNLNQLNILHIKHSSPIVHLYISILEKSENETTLHKKIIMIRTSSKNIYIVSFVAWNYSYMSTHVRRRVQKGTKWLVIFSWWQKVRYEAANQTSPSIIRD